MAITQDIVATYRGPGAVMRRLLARGQREDRALAILMAGCLLVFVSQWPPLARQAHFDGQELNPLLGGALLAWVMIAPLIFYGLAALSHLLARALGGQGSFFGARLALFWALALVLTRRRNHMLRRQDALRAKFESAVVRDTAEQLRRTCSTSTSTGASL